MQVNGKLRDRIDVPADATDDDLERLALANPRRFRRSSTGRKIVKVIVVPGKLVNVVAR